MSTKNFYKAFEDRHRGPRTLIKDRVSVYLPFVTPLKTIYADNSALDIGCGRGEWLELLKENGIPAKGIDLDKGMLKVGKKLSLDVELGDGIEYLSKQADESMTIISAFHVVEHISFDDLHILVKEALRVLKPAGILILETPNPENIKVATENFYLDPTHIRPIPSALLSFLPEFYGYGRTKVLRLQESQDIVEEEHIRLEQVFAGASPDYGVVAQKKASKKIFHLFDKSFSKEFGLSLDTLSGKFEYRLLSMEKRVSEAEANANQAELKSTEAESKAIQAEAKARETEINFNALLNSNSWHFTRPLRIAGQFVRWFTTGVKHWVTFSPTSRPRRMLKQTFFGVQNYLERRHPKIKGYLLQLINRFPSLKMKLKKMMEVHPTSSLVLDTVEVPSEIKYIYDDIMQEIEKQKGEQ